MTSHAHFPSLCLKHALPEGLVIKSTFISWISKHNSHQIRSKSAPPILAHAKAPAPGCG
eukprot:CAMPEP_0168405126 /NCGR_PEP_ID=MMETSP0228-20121227/24983_1 /TAXON_ID=133427 /ORGANISM="Protoceratium reticulatum, Strain CCCM 535 (=CCMP 1889)" /LENGTH=58 /DNA_ID=CAMNT_0008418749 /DNA_START=79 /DNA_END=251 /DNA_ORIENTATION=+